MPLPCSKRRRKKTIADKFLNKTNIVTMRSFSGCLCGPWRSGRQIRLRQQECSHGNSEEIVRAITRSRSHDRRSSRIKYRLWSILLNFWARSLKKWRKTGLSCFSALKQKSGKHEIAHYWRKRFSKVFISVRKWRLQLIHRHNLFCIYPIFNIS